MFVDSLDGEEWKEIPGFNGAYMVSNYGRVLSVSRTVRSGKTNFVKTKDIIMKSHKNKKGYDKVSFNLNGKTKSVFVHRLVATAFIANPNNKPQVNHIDGNKSNNVVLNLEWCTNGENQIHAYSLGLNKVTGRAGRKKIRVRQIDPITGIAIAEYDSLADAGRKTDAHWINIRNAALGKRKTAGGYQWAFA